MEMAFTALAVMLVVMGMVLALPRLACRIGLVDEPSCRKLHEGHVPLIGGLAMFTGFCVGMTLIDSSWVRFPALILGACLLVLVGVLDDMRDLRKRIRFPAQIIAALLMCLLGGIVLEDLGWLAMGNLLTLGVLAIPFTIFCTVGVINAVNMSDGLDGLAGGLVLVTLGSLAYLSYDAGVSRDLDVLLVLVACVVGFLIFNLRSPWSSRARVFMGDAGSLFLGFVIARFLIDFSQGIDRIMYPATALWIFAVPLMDTVAIMLRRMAERQSPFAADRRHLHHLLIDAGFSVGQTVILIWGLAVVLAGIGIAAQGAGITDGQMFVGFLVLFGFYGLGLRIVEKRVQSGRGLIASPNSGSVFTGGRG